MSLEKPIYKSQVQASIQVSIDAIARRFNLNIDDTLSLLMARAAMAVYEASGKDEME